MKGIFLTAFLSIALMSCNSDDNGGNVGTEEVEFTNVAQSYIPNTPYEDNPNAQNMVISDDDTWQDFTEELGTAIDETTIDFANYQAIVVIDDMRPAGRYSIDIVSVTVNRQNISVSIETTFVEQITFQMPIQPYHIVKIPKTEKPVVFE